MIKILAFILLACMWSGCYQINKDIQEHVSDTLHTLSKERFDRFSDSFNADNLKSLDFMVTHKYDSSLFYSGKATAYFEMETKELHK